MHVGKSSPAQAAIAHRSTADEQESTATWPTLASRKHSLLGLDSAETDDGECGGKHRQQNAESTQIFERLTAARDWCRIFFLRFSRTDGAILPSLEVVKPRQTETERTLGIPERLRNLWRSWLFADFYRVQVPVLLGSLLLLFLSFVIDLRGGSFPFWASHSTARQDGPQGDARQALAPLTQAQGPAGAPPLTREWIKRIPAGLRLDQIVEFFYPSSSESKIQGNADAVVWADSRKGLYYCMGEKPRGTRPKGRYISQKEAQRLSFEPAYRRACR